MTNDNSDSYTNLEIACKAKLLALSSAYSPDLMCKAEERMNSELKVIKRFNYSDVFYVLKNVVDCAEENKKFILWRDRLYYSYVAYLLGITSVDPVLCDYPFAFFCGPYCDNLPFIFMFDTSWNFKSVLVEYLKSCYGDELVCVEDDSIVINLYPMCSDVLKITACEKEYWQHCQDAFAEKDQFLRSDFHRDFSINDKDLSKALFDELLYFCQAYGKDEYGPYYVYDHNTVDSLINALATIFGKGVYEAKLGLYSRDDFFRFFMCAFDGNLELSYKATDYIRKGKASDAYLQQLLNSHNIDPDFCESIKSVKDCTFEAPLIVIGQYLLFSAEKRVKRKDTSGYQITDKDGREYRIKAICTLTVDGVDYIVAHKVDDRSKAVFLKVIFKNGIPDHLGVIEDKKEYDSVAELFKESDYSEGYDF